MMVFRYLLLKIYFLNAQQTIKFQNFNLIQRTKTRATQIFIRQTAQNLNFNFCPPAKKPKFATPLSNPPAKFLAKKQILKFSFNSRAKNPSSPCLYTTSAHTASQTALPQSPRACARQSNSPAIKISRQLLSHN